MIKFNEITWYSKLAAIIFFLGILPALTFYIGTQYQKAKSGEEIQPTIYKPATHTSSSPQKDMLQGSWRFEEVAPGPNANGITIPGWEYTLRVDPQDSTKGTLSIDGYQTLTRINVQIQKLSDSANVVFDSYGPENQYELYKKGDILFTIEPIDTNTLLIEWNKMQPNVELGKVKAYFKRSTS